jgi:hypothetical protein
LGKAYCVQALGLKLLKQGLTRDKASGDEGSVPGANGHLQCAVTRTARQEGPPQR